jgi:nucleoside-diphosphate-sugar epimerase
LAEKPIFINKMLVKEESKLKQSLAASGRTGEKNHMYGKNHTEESKKKMSESHSGEKNFWYGKNHTEETKLKQSLVKKGKLKSEEHILAKGGTIFRLGTVFGLGDTYSRLRMDLVVNTLTAKAFIENKINVFGGEQYRPLLHVRDAAKAIYESISSKEVGIFNLSLDNFKIIDIANSIKDHFPGLEILIEDIPFQDTRNYRVDNSKSLNLLNFKADILLLDGIKEIKKL